MLSKENTETLCRVGPGTVMGDLMRQYWLPCTYSWELTPDGDPVPHGLSAILYGVKEMVCRFDDDRPSHLLRRVGNGRAPKRRIDFP